MRAARVTPLKQNRIVYRWTPTFREYPVHADGQCIGITSREEPYFRFVKLAIDSDVGNKTSHPQAYCVIAGTTTRSAFEQSRLNECHRTSQQCDLIVLADVPEDAQTTRDPQRLSLAHQRGKVLWIAPIAFTAGADERDCRPGTRQAGECLEGCAVILVLPKLVADDEIGPLNAVLAGDLRLCCKPLGLHRRTEGKCHDSRGSCRMECTRVVRDSARVDDDGRRRDQHRAERLVTSLDLVGRKKMRHVPMLEVIQISNPWPLGFVAQRNKSRQQGIETQTICCRCCSTRTTIDHVHRHC